MHTMDFSEPNAKVGITVYLIIVDGSKSQIVYFNPTNNEIIGIAHDHYSQWIRETVMREYEILAKLNMRSY